MIEIKGPGKVFFGIRKRDRAAIYLEKPSWSCGWYWGFGYLGNARESYHLESYQQEDRRLELADGKLKFFTEKRNINMYDALLEDYELNKTLLGEQDKLGSYRKLWTFCELALTAYALREAAEVFRRGGSHMTTNPCAEIIKNQDEVKRINETVLPAIFNAIADLFEEDK